MLSGIIFANHKFFTNDQSQKHKSKSDANPL